MPKYDVIVVGVGAMGSSACYHLARRGASVLGLEQFDIGNGLGSSHGFSRIFRLAYFEHSDYVELLRRALELWGQLESDSQQKLLYATGALYMGHPACQLIRGSLQVAIEHNLVHETLDRDALQQRYSQFHLPPDFVGLYEQTAGFLVPERVVAAQAEQALRHGGHLRGHEPVVSWEASGSRVTVKTPRSSYEADHLVFCGGAWSDDIVDDLGPPLKVTRQVMAWVWPQQPQLFALGKFPVWAVDVNDPQEPQGIHYGFPMMADNPGFKIALHWPASPTEPNTVDRRLQPGDEETFRPFLAKVLPDADGPLLSLRTCLYVNSPDSHFIIDRHPNQRRSHNRVTIACGFSGHGFKFASVVGQVLADMALNGKTELPIEFLGLSRFR